MRHNARQSDNNTQFARLKALLHDRKIGCRPVKIGVRTSEESHFFFRRGFRATDICGPKAKKKKGPDLGPVSRTSRELFGPEKLVVKLQSACFQKLIFLHAFNMRKIKRIAKFEGLEPRRCEDIKGIVVPDIGPKSFGTFEKQAPVS